MTRLYLVRHGQASFGTGHYDRLSSLGERQSHLLGQHLQRIGFRADAWLCGTLERQCKTLACVLQGLGDSRASEALPAFNEYDHEAIFEAYLPRVMTDLGHAPEKRAELLADVRQFEAAFMGAMSHWMKGTPIDAAPAESWSAFRDRVHEGLRHLAASGRERIVVVTSGGPIACAVRAALGLTPEQTLSLNWGIYNASVTELRVRRGALLLSGFNAVAHLELAGDPSLLTYR
jgi:broad specificity phosphatase PhoE